MREARLWQLKGAQCTVARPPYTQSDKLALVQHERGQRQAFVSKAFIAQPLEHSAPLPCPWCGRAEQAEVKIKELKGELRGATLGLCAKGNHATPP